MPDEPEPHIPHCTPSLAPGPSTQNECGAARSYIACRQGPEKQWKSVAAGLEPSSYARPPAYVFFLEIIQL